MTTIVYKDGIIACDSRVTMGDVIISDDVDKIVYKGGAIFAFSGEGPSFEFLIEAFFDDFYPDNHKFVGSGIAYFEDELYILGHHSDNGFWKQPWDKRMCYAIGSGRDHALTALDMGCTPVEAVKLAMKRDTCTGGKVKKVRLW